MLFLFHFTHKKLIELVFFYMQQFFRDRVGYKFVKNMVFEMHYCA